MKDQIPSQDHKQSGTSKMVSKIDDEKVTPASNSKVTRNNLRSVHNQMKEAPSNTNEAHHDSQELSKDKNQTKSKELTSSQSDAR